MGMRQMGIGNRESEMSNGEQDKVHLHQEVQKDGGEAVSTLHIPGKDHGNSGSER